jgi:plastocyanin
MKRIFFSYFGAGLLIILAIYGSIANDKAATNEVVIDRFSFRPDKLTVPVGTTVTWINRDDVPHAVVSKDKKTIVSAAMDTDGKFSYTFIVAGTNDYYCSVHPFMKGRIIVQ